MCRLELGSLPPDAIVVYAGDDGFADVVVFPPKSWNTLLTAGKVTGDGGLGGHIVYISNTYLNQFSIQSRDWRALFMNLVKMLALRQTSGWNPATRFSDNAGRCATCK